MQLLRDMLQACRSEFAENVRINAALDDKAQKTGALSGIFLAAGFAFLKPENLIFLNNFGGWRSLAPLVVSVLMLMISVVICLTVMWVRTMPATPAVDVLMHSAENLLALPSGELTSQRLENDLRETIKMWQVSLEFWITKVNSKGRWLNVGQTCLVIAMGSITYLLVYILYRGVWR